MKNFDVLVAHACEHPAVWPYLRSRLNLERRPLNRVDAHELEMLRALTPVLNRHPGDRAAIRRACPPRWIAALDQILAVPDRFMERAGAIPELAARWAKYGSKGWQLPPFVDHAKDMRPPRRHPAAKVAA